MGSETNPNEVRPEEAMIQVKVDGEPVMTAVMDEDDVAEFVVDDTYVEIWRVGADGPPDGWW